MAEGGGQSARVRELLERRRRQLQAAAAQQSTEPENNNQPPSDENQNAPVKDVPMKGLGRAQFLANLRKKKEEKVGAPTSSNQEESTAPAPLSGRAAIMAKLAAKNKEKGEKKESSTPQGGSSAAPSGDSGRMTEFMRNFEDMKVGPQDNVQRKLGSKGTEFEASANIIRLRLKESYSVFEYHVKFNPVLDSIKDKKQVVRQLVDTIGKVRTFDGATLSLPKMLEKPRYVLTAQSLSGESVAVTITANRRKELSECEPLFNVLFNKIFEMLKMVEIKRNHYDPAARMMVPAHKLEIWPGYVNRVKELDGGLMLVCDTSFKLLRQETAYTMMKDVRKKYPSNFKDQLEKSLVGAIVMTEYNKATTYRVDDIDFDQTPLSTFTTYSGSEISYKSYYKKVYDIDIKDDKQPMLVHRMRKKEAKDTEEIKIILLVPELCRMTGLTDDMRSDFRVMKDVATHTRVSPDTRQTALKRFIENVLKNQECVQLLDQWGLELDREPIRMTGRTMDREKLLVGNGRTFEVNSKADWGRESTNNTCLKAVALKRWHVVCADRNKLVTEGFIKLMKKLAPKMGISVDEPTLSVLANDRTETFVKDLQSRISSSLQLVVVIVPLQREDRYAALKKLCNTECPIPSQVICAKTITNEKKVQSVTMKVALQINCKLGGELWGAKIPVKHLMVIGLDVYHDPTRKRPSVTGVVGSMNQTMSAWHSTSEFQRPGQELVDVIMMCVGKLIGMYEKKNGTKPEQIILYRDGVSNGQVEHVMQIEADKCEELFRRAKFEPEFSFIIVQKRINRKFFDVVGNKYSNPPPGSVLDHTIMKKSFYDFLLVSQHVSQGVVNPTHYIIARDTTSFTPDQMQKLTYKLAHMYFNWPGTVRVPAPCLYAHKLAYQIGECTQVEPSQELSDKLFFL